MIFIGHNYIISVSRFIFFILILFGVISKSHIFATQSGNDWLQNNSFFDIEGD